MLFTELIFIPFLMVTFFLFYFARKSPRSQLTVLLGASFVFYAWWDIRFLGLILISSLFNYTVGNLIYNTKEKKKKKLFLIIGLIVNLGVLGFFKYSNFFIDTIITLLDNLGIKSGLNLLNIVIPLGISFYTFWTLSYIIDIYW
jgi:alginate O-acetyltransferase complex protein AlgI